jgi:hypothetical protein
MMSAGYVQRKIREIDFWEKGSPFFACIGWPFLALYLIGLKYPMSMSHRLGMYLHDKQEEITRVRVTTKKRINLEKEVADKKYRLELEQASRELDAELARKHI